MYIDRSVLSEYPFSGVFYTTEDIMPEDGNLLADDITETTREYIIDTVSCDIQGSNKMLGNGASGSYLDIFFPFEKKDGVKVRIGHRFKSDDWYRPVDGKVISVVPTQMGGCVVQIKEVGIDL